MPGETLGLARPAAAALSVAGVTGKLPSHGDFVRLGASPGLAERLDGWAAAGLQALEERFGGLIGWDAAPPWRCLLAPGEGAPDWTVGLVAASVDRPGREFPLMLSVEIADPALAAACGFRLAERLETLAYWALENGVTAPDLREAVEAAATSLRPGGDHPAAVEVEAALEQRPQLAGSRFWTLGGGGALPRLVRADDGLTTALFVDLFAPTGDVA